MSRVLVTVKRAWSQVSDRLWYLVVPGSQMVVGVLVLPAMTRFSDQVVLGQASVLVSAFLLALSVAALGTPAGMGLIGAERPASDVMAYAILPSGVASLVGALSATAIMLTFGYVGSPLIVLGLGLGGATLLLSMASVARGRSRARLYALTSTTVLAGPWIGGAVGVLGYRSVSGFAAGYGAWLVLVGSLISRNHPLNVPRDRWLAVRRGLPSVPHGLALQALNSGDRLVVGSVLGAAAAGAYHAGYVLGSVVIAGSSALAYHVSGRIYRGEAADARADCRLSRLFVLASIVTVTVLGERILGMLYGASLDISNASLIASQVALSGIAMFEYQLGFHSRLARGLRGWLVWSAVLVASVSLLAAGLLAVAIGSTVVAVATVGGYSALALIFRTSQPRPLRSRWSLWWVVLSPVAAFGVL